MSDEKETRTVSDAWDLSLYKWKVEAEGLKLLVDGFRDKKVLGRKCGKCRTVYIPGVSYCRKCFVDIDQVVEVKPVGKIGTFTVNVADVRGNPLDEPQVICCFQLEGADSWLMGNLETRDWKKVYVGMPVKIRFREQTRGELADLECWVPVEK